MWTPGSPVGSRRPLPSAKGLVQSPLGERTVSPAVIGEELCTVSHGSRL